MGLSTPAFTLVHVALGLIGVVTGLIVLYGMLAAKKLAGWTDIFLVTTVLTSVTGFMLPADHLLPSHIIGFLSLAVLALAIAAYYFYRLRGSWRWIYVIGALIALYLNVFVTIFQAFLKLPFLQRLAPTQSEPPFLAAQLIALAAFIWLGYLALKSFIRLALFDIACLRRTPKEDGVQSPCPASFSQSSSLIVSTPSSAALASLEPAPGPATRRSVFFDTEPATLAPRRSAMAFASSRVIRSSAPVKTTVLPATGDEMLRASKCRHLHMLEKIVDHVAIVFLAEKLRDRLGHHFTNAIKGRQFRAGLGTVSCAASRLAQARRSRSPGPGPAVRLADMSDAEREDETVERQCPPRFDCGKEIFAASSPQPSRSLSLIVPRGFRVSAG